MTKRDDYDDETHILVSKACLRNISSAMQNLMAQANDAINYSNTNQLEEDTLIRAHLALEKINDLL